MTLLLTPNQWVMSNISKNNNLFSILLDCNEIHTLKNNKIKLHYVFILDMYESILNFYILKESSLRMSAPFQAGLDFRMSALGAVLQKYGKCIWFSIGVELYNNAECFIFNNVEDHSSLSKWEF